MMFRPSLYPSLICEYDYSSRNQPDANLYKQLKAKRIKAKHNGDKKIADALKLPLNTYYGALGAKWNKLYDLKQCRSICISGQCVLLILIHDLRKIPSVRIVESNTDAVEFEIDEDKLSLAENILIEWQKRYRLELERDDVVKLVMRDVNNYCSILETEKGQTVNFKGNCFKGCPNIKIHQDGRIETIYKNSFTDNSLIIVKEALLKKLLFDISVEKTINNCKDIHKFQLISHLGGTYEKCIQESENGDIELQKNNRIYAGNIPSGTIKKVKPDGRRDSLALCPANPIVDNANQCTINDINKQWYIDLANQRADDFLGIKRLEDYKKDELLELAKKEYNIEFDKKTKKEDLIKIIKQCKSEGDKKTMAKQELEEKLQKSMEQNEQLVEKLKERHEKMEENKTTPCTNCTCNNDLKALYLKINEFRKKVRERKFILDKELPSNLGGGEYYSIEQFYNAVQELCIEVGLDFSFETTNLIQFDKSCTSPSGKLPIHVATVETLATLTDIDTGECKEYVTVAQGSDTIDKAVSSASSMAFRQWFYKNFTPKDMPDDDNNETSGLEKSETPKVPVYIPEQKKEEIKKEVVKQEQHEESDDEDIKAICENIMKVREKINDDTWGANTLEKIMSGKCTSVDLMEIDLKVKNKMEKVGL